MKNNNHIHTYLQRQFLFWQTFFISLFGINFFGFLLLFIFYIWLYEVDHLNNTKDSIFWFFSGIIMFYYQVKSFIELRKGIDKVKSSVISIKKPTKTNYSTILWIKIKSIAWLLCFQIFLFISHDFTFKNMFSVILFDLSYLTMNMYLETYKRLLLKMDKKMLKKIVG